MRYLPALLSALLLGATVTAETLRLGVSDPLCRKSACECISQNAIRAYDQMVKMVEADTGIKLEMVYFEDPLLLQQDIAKGNLDGMICKTWTGLQIGREAHRSFARLADILKPAPDRSHLTGIFIVLASSPIKTMADLKGKKVILGQNNDYEKHYLAMQTLKKHQIEIAADSPQLFSCKEAALALLENRADAAVISNYAFDFGCIVVVGDPKDFRTIGATDQEIPFTSLFVAEKVPAAQREKLKAALLKITGKNVPAGLFSSGWAEPLPWQPGELENK